MKQQSILGFSSAAIVTMGLFISVTGFDLPNIGGGKIGSTIGKSIGSVVPVPTSAVTGISNFLYDWEVSNKKPKDNPDMNAQNAQMEKINAQMKEIFDRLKRAAESDPKYGAIAKETNWRLNTLRDKENGIVTATAYSGGGIAIYTGVLPIAKDEGALASILGHELIHVLAQHGLERTKSTVGASVLTIGPLIASGVTPDKMDPKVIGPVAAALGAGYLFGVHMPLEREHELEADCSGLMLAAKAGYDPRKIGTFWERMNGLSAEDKKKYHFLDAHPMNQERLDHIKSDACMRPALDAYTDLVQKLRAKGEEPPDSSKGLLRDIG